MEAWIADLGAVVKAAGHDDDDDDDDVGLVEPLLMAVR